MGTQGEVPWVYLLCGDIQYKSDAVWFYEHLKHRMGHFGLKLPEEEKSRLIEFGRYAKERCSKKWNEARYLYFPRFYTLLFQKQEW